MYAAGCESPAEVRDYPQRSGFGLTLSGLCRQTRFVAGRIADLRLAAGKVDLGAVLLGEVAIAKIKRGDQPRVIRWRGQRLAREYDGRDDLSNDGQNERLRRRHGIDLRHHRRLELCRVDR